jgi:hypothetical protein
VTGKAEREALLTGARGVTGHAIMALQIFTYRNPQNGLIIVMELHIV